MSLFARLTNQFSTKMENYATAEAAALRPSGHGKLRLIGIAIGILVVILLAVWISKGEQQSKTTEKCSNFQVVSDRSVYSPGDKLQLKLILTNNGNVPLYVSRQVGCGGPTGFAVVDIVDESGQRFARNCYLDRTEPSDTELLEEMRNPELWIQLQPGEIYGQERAYDIPSVKGSYRITAYLIPPGFKEVQLTLLSKKGICVQRSLCKASEISITVK